MSRKRGKKNNTGRFAGIPTSVMGTQQFIDLSSNEKALLLELAFQYGGYNNGNLTACYTVMKKRGWASATLWRSLSGLIHTGFVVVTRQGIKQRGCPTLLALTYQPIDEPPAHIIYDDGIKPSPVPLGFWSKAKKSWSIQPERKEPVRKALLQNETDKGR